jgi:hypothetical protein
MHKNDEQADRTQRPNVNADQEAFTQPIAIVGAYCGYDHSEQNRQANEGKYEPNGRHKEPLSKCPRNLPPKSES